jgi:hypothetical protein
LRYNIGIICVIEGTQIKLQFDEEEHYWALNEHIAVLTPAFATDAAGDRGFRFVDDPAFEQVANSIEDLQISRNSDEDHTGDVYSCIAASFVRDIRLPTRRIDLSTSDIRLSKYTIGILERFSRNVGMRV